MTISDLDRATSHLSSHLRHLEQVMKSTLDPFCSRFRYPVVSRIKSYSSVVQKIETGRYKSFLEIDDLVAFTIIIPTGSHEAKCIEFLRGTFDIINIRGRSQSSRNPKQFVFDSTRIYLRRKKPEWEENKNDITYKVIIEVQIQTALEHAWIVATHDVVYKSDSIDWQKVRLAAQTKAQVETINLIFNKFEYFSKSLENYPWKEGEQTSLVIKFFQELCEAGIVPSEKMPDDKIRLAENALKILSRSSILDLSKSLTDIRIAIHEIAQQGFPQSLTLIQTFTLAAIRSKKQANSSTSFVPHITSSFERMFPEIKLWGVKFNYDVIESLDEDSFPSSGSSADDAQRG